MPNRAASRGLEARQSAATFTPNLIRLGSPNSMHDAPMDANEHREHAEHAAHAKNPVITSASITIALLAVVTAVVGSLETLENGGAITEASRAVLAQDKATDAWSFYQAKSIKKRLDTMAAEQGGPRAEDYRLAAIKEGEEEKAIQAEAKQDEKDRDVLLESSERHEQRHHRLTAAATLLEMGIAIATIAIITGRRWPWAVSVLLGAGGLAAGVWALGL
jgi:hypothetical protein